MKKLFFCAIALFSAIGMNAQMAVPVEAGYFNLINSSNWNGHWFDFGKEGEATFRNFDASAYDYVWILFSGNTGRFRLGVAYSEWESTQAWGESYYNNYELVYDEKGIAFIKIEKEATYEYDVNYTDNPYKGDTWDKHIYQVFLQDDGDPVNVMVKGMWFGTEAELNSAIQALSEDDSSLGGNDDIEVANKDGVPIYYKWINEKEELAVTFKTNSQGAFIDGGYSGNVVIPESVEYEGKTYSVTSIGNYAFSGCNELTGVTIPNSVSSICDNVFASCYSLTSVTIPNSVTYIGGWVFQDCINLSSLTISNSATSIGALAFKGCSALTSVIIPNSVTSIGNSAFSDCSSLTSVIISNNLELIDGSVFQNCSSLTSVTIPSSVTEISSMAFDGCNLTDVYCWAENVPKAVADAFNYEDILLYVPSNSIDAYKAKEPWSLFKGIEPLSESINISTAGQTTWCSAYDLDFTNVEGLKAYTAGGYDRETGTIWLMRVKKVPAGEGILLVGEEGEYKVPHKSTTAYYMNMFKGILEAKTINETDGEYTNYYLSNGASGIGFYKVNGSVDIKANRAYLPLLKNTVSSSRGFIGMDFDDDEDGTTGIESVNGSGLTVQGSKDVYYNLQGQRVDNPSKGLYIRNGKKVVIK